LAPKHDWPAPLIGVAYGAGVVGVAFVIILVTVASPWLPVGLEILVVVVLMTLVGLSPKLVSLLRGRLDARDQLRSLRKSFLAERRPYELPETDR